MFREEERRCLFKGGTVGIPFCMGKIERKTKVTRKQGQHESCLETAACKCIGVESQPHLATRSDQHAWISCCILWMVWIFPHPRQNTRVDFSLSHTPFHSISFPNPCFSSLPNFPAQIGFLKRQVLKL